jgi:hypothetical protein
LHARLLPRITADNQPSRADRAALDDRCARGAHRGERASPGLRPFSSDNAKLFFGRRAEVEALVARLRAGERELYIVGASGSRPVPDVDRGWNALKPNVPTRLDRSRPGG